MSDLKVREIERRAVTGDPEAEVRLLWRRLRRGEVDLQQLEVVAYAGSSVARAVLGAEDWPAPAVPLAWLRGLTAWGPAPLLEGVRAWREHDPDDCPDLLEIDLEAADAEAAVIDALNARFYDQPELDVIAPAVAGWSLRAPAGVLSSPTDLPDGATFGHRVLLHGVFLGPVDGERLGDLLAALRSEDRWLKIDALGTLATVSRDYPILGPALLPAVVTALDDEDHWVREAAAESLRKVERCEPDALTALERRLTDDHPDVRCQAAAALAHLAPERSSAAIESLRASLHDGVEAARSALLEVCPHEVHVHDTLRELGPKWTLLFIVVVSTLVAGILHQADGWSALGLAAPFAVACAVKVELAWRARPETFKAVLADGILFLSLGWLTVLLALASGAWYLAPLGLVGMWISLHRFGNYMGLREYVRSTWPDTHHPADAGETE